MILYVNGVLAAATNTPVRPFRGFGHKFPARGVIIGNVPGMEDRVSVA